MLTRKDFLRVGAFGVAGAFLASPLEAQASPLEAQAAGAKRTWIMAAETFDAALGRDPELAQAMSAETCHVIGKGPSSYGATRIRSYCVRDYRDIRERIDLGRLGEGETIVYAIENGNGIDPNKQTPIYQQMDLVGSIKAATSLCHSVGATLIAAPAGSILDNIDPESTNRLEAMLRNRIPETCALYADAYDIQVQQSLQNVQKYTTYVEGCAAQARAAAPEKPILAGLTTNSLRSEPKDYPTAREISAAAEAVRGVVQGYWLSVPPHRSTGESNYAKARRSLRLVYGLSIT